MTPFYDDLCVCSHRRGAHKEAKPKWPSTRCLVNGCPCLEFAPGLTAEGAAT